MTDFKKDDNDNGSGENLFQIMEGIIHQLNKTKKIFVTLLIAHLIIVPITFVVIFAIFGPPFAMGGPWWWHDGTNPWPRYPFPLVPIIPITAVLIWLGFGIRQWLALSKWTKKYELYKKLQKKIDEKLDYDDDDSEEQ